MFHLTLGREQFLGCEMIILIAVTKIFCLLICRSQKKKIYYLKVLQRILIFNRFFFQVETRM